MNNIKVSVIIPVYNTEKHLRKCLDTVCNQTLKDIEIICVNDGSTDSSLQILQEYSKEYTTITIINQQHQGTASSRNKALALAQGKYLSFLDSDDFFESDMLEQMYNCAEEYNTDIVICKSKIFENGWISDNYDIQENLLPKKEIFSAHDIPKYAFQFHKGWCWNKLYNSSFIKSLGISFQNLKKHNDSFFSHISIIKAKRIYFLNKKFIYYRKTSIEELLQKLKGNEFEFYKSLKAIREYLLKENLYKTFEQSFVNHCLRQFTIYNDLLPVSFYKVFLNNLQIKGYDKDFFYQKKHYIMYIISSHLFLILLLKLFVKVKYYTKMLILKIRPLLKKILFSKTRIRLKKKDFKLIPQKKLKYFCVHIVDHCNLRCQYCDHFSPLAKEWYADLEVFERDFKQFSLLSNQQVERIGLLGGEPLLHPKIAEFAKIARKYFPYSKINIVTNGLLLLTKDADFWNTCRKNNIIVAVTKYPINLNYDKIQETANKYNVVLEFYNNTDKQRKTSYHIPLDLNGKQDSTDNFIRCFHANYLTLLRDGKLYPCTVAPNAFKFNDFFNKDLPKPEGIDIYKAKNMDEVLDFISKPINFCKYCYVKKRTFNHTWDRSKKNIKEWTI